MSDAQQQAPGCPSLDWFRENGYAIPATFSGDGFQKVRSGKIRKVYGQPKVWRYVPTRFRTGKYDMPSEKLRSSVEISGYVDKRPLEELSSAATELLGQILIRAAAGDERAMGYFTHRVCALVQNLELLKRKQPEKLRTVAERESRWPVLLSLNPQDLTIAKSMLRDLHVGEKAVTPTREGQKVDRRNFWTRLADWAADECVTTGINVRILERHAADANAETKRVVTKFWRTPVEITMYLWRPGTCVEIADWQKRCASLSKPINVDDWWPAIKGFVLQYWQYSEEAYRAALKQISYADTAKTGKTGRKLRGESAEARQRGHALNQVKHALYSLAGLRVRQQTPPVT